MSALIRDAKPEDVEGIARVHVQGWRESYKSIMSPQALQGLSLEQRIAMWVQAFASSEPRAKFLVAEREGEIVGFARGGPVRSEGIQSLGTEAEIYAIYLLDRVKRLGIGSRLLLGVFSHLAAQGFRSCGLWVLTNNMPARRFYERFGGIAGVEQPIVMQSETVMETAYRFEPIPFA